MTGHDRLQAFNWHCLSGCVLTLVLLGQTQNPGHAGSRCESSNFHLLGYEDPWHTGSICHSLCSYPRSKKEEEGESESESESERRVSWRLKRRRSPRRRKKSPPPPPSCRSSSSTALVPGKKRPSTLTRDLVQSGKNARPYCSDSSRTPACKFCHFHV